jgi:hypothetical protein
LVICNSNCIVSKCIVGDLIDISGGDPNVATTTTTTTTTTTNKPTIDVNTTGDTTSESAAEPNGDEVERPSDGYCLYAFSSNELKAYVRYVCGINCA